MWHDRDSNSWPFADRGFTELPSYRATRSSNQQLFTLNLPLLPNHCFHNYRTHLDMYTCYNMLMVYLFFSSDSSTCCINFGESGDFSCNARSGMIEKYSQNSNQLPCWHSDDLIYVSNVRELLFQFNPNYIICPYKKMFEMASLSNLRLVEDQYNGDLQR